MIDIVVLGSLNMDLVIKTPRMPVAGETIHGQDLKLIPGGKGANQALAAAKLGASVAMVGKVGHDPFGAELVSGLNNHGVDTRLVSVDPEAATGTAMIIIDQEGENRIILSEGANGRLTREDVDRAEPLLKEACIVTLQFEIPLEVVDYALAKVAGLGVRTILNPAPCRPVSREFLARADCLVLNETETRMLTGHQVESLHEAHQAAQTLLTWGIAEVILTLGDRGALLANRDGVTHVPARKVQVIDTTGAGDAFVGALAVARVHGLGSREAVRSATCAGTLAVTKLGAQTSLPSADELEVFCASRQAVTGEDA